MSRGRHGAVASCVGSGPFYVQFWATISRAGDSGGWGTSLTAVSLPQVVLQEHHPEPSGAAAEAGGKCWLVGLSHTWPLWAALSPSTAADKDRAGELWPRMAWGARQEVFPGQELEAGLL